MSGKKDCTWINNQLQNMLSDEKHKDDAALIKLVLESDDFSAKYNLFNLYMNKFGDEAEIKNLKHKLVSLYSEDEDINKYVEELVLFNPKLNMVEMTTPSRGTMDLDSSFYLVIGRPKYNPENMDEWFNEANEIVKRGQDYLKIVITEAKKISK